MRFINWLGAFDLKLIKHRIREPRHDSSTNIPMQFREREWCGANRFKSANDRIEKLVAKTGLLLLIPFGRFD